MEKQKLETDEAPKNNTSFVNGNAFHKHVVYSNNKNKPLQKDNIAT